MLGAELLKITTLPASKIALAVGVAGLMATHFLTVLLLPALASGQIGPGPEALGGAIPTPDLQTAAGQLALLGPLGTNDSAGSLGIAVIAIVLMGVLAGTSDYRFGGIVTTALAQPKRLRILAAKAAAAGVAGLVAGAVLAVAASATLLLTLAFAGTALAIEPAAAVAVLLRSALAVACLTIIALAVGIAAKNQLAAVLLMLGLLLLEMIIQSVAVLIAGSMPLWAQLMPLTLCNAVIGTGPAGISTPVASAALLALTGTALAIAALALHRRDI